jgi:uncharacterized sulfatase
MDRQMGEVADSLRRHGFADNTLFVFTADQGAQWPFGKWNLYDEGIRAPLIIRWPGKIKPGATSDAMISLVDLLPTFVEIAGGKAAPDWDGRSFHREIQIHREFATRHKVHQPHQRRRRAGWPWVLGFMGQIG